MQLATVGEKKPPHVPTLDQPAAAPPPPLTSHVTAGVTTGCSDTCAEIMVRGGRDAAVSPSPRRTNGGFPRLSVDMQEMERERERGH